MRIRRVMTPLLLVSLCFATLRAYQNKDTEKSRTTSSDQDVELTTVGETKLSTGRRGTFRIYTARDGTKATLTYGQFQSVNDAQHQVLNWLKLAQRVQSKGQMKGESGQVTGDRIVATAKNVRTGGRKFLIIRRDSLNCYLIESQSLPVAMQVEELTK